MKRTKTVAERVHSQVIDSIVAEVLQQLRGRVGPAQKSEANGSANTAIEIADPVITGDLLKEKISQGGTVWVDSQAVLTPSARDFLRAEKITLHRGRPDQNVDAVKRKGVIVAAHLPGVVQNLLSDVKRNGSASWQVEMESGVFPVVERTRSAICRGESPQVVVFAKTPHRVACLVNRNSQCRAAVVQGNDDVRTVRSEFAANVICVDLRQPTFMGLKKIIKASQETVNLIKTETRP